MNEQKTILANSSPLPQLTDKGNERSKVRFITPQSGEFDAVLKAILPGMKQTIEFLKDK